jgi:hypothetical protein
VLVAAAPMKRGVGDHLEAVGFGEPTQRRLLNPISIVEHERAFLLEQAGGEVPEVSDSGSGVVGVVEQNPNRPNRSGNATRMSSFSAVNFRSPTYGATLAVNSSNDVPPDHASP